MAYGAPRVVPPQLVLRHPVDMDVAEEAVRRWAEEEARRAAFSSTLLVSPPSFSLRLA